MATNLSSRLRKAFTKNDIVCCEQAIAEALLCERMREKRPLFLRDGADLSHTWKINAVTSHRYLEALGFSRNGSGSRISQQ